MAPSKLLIFQCARVFCSGVKAPRKRLMFLCNACVRVSPHTPMRACPYGQHCTRGKEEK